MVDSPQTGGEEIPGGSSTGAEHSKRTDPKLVRSKIPDDGGLGTERGERNRSQESLPDIVARIYRAMGGVVPSSPPPKSVTPLDEEGFYDISSADEAEIRGLILGLLERWNNIRARQIYAKLIFALLVIWLFLVILTVWSSGATVTLPKWWPEFLPTVREFKLSDSVLIALVTTTTANIIGLLILVVRYLFPVQSQDS